VRDEREKLRATFAEAAELYDRARPGYPSELFEDLAELAGVGPGCRLLEIGCGTGQATVPLAERGCRVVAVELGARLAEVARRKLAGYPDVAVVTAAFEDWAAPSGSFDVVLAATAFHWIDPAVRVAKCADILRPGGALATIATYHIGGGSWTSAFTAQIQGCYERFDPATPPGLRMQCAADIPYDPEELPGFAPPEFRRYEWELPYTTEGYLELLLTYSGHRALPAAARTGLFSCLADLIDSRYGGRIVKRYLTELRVAQRLPV
jgi:SAM-dependent methyltransferase